MAWEGVLCPTGGGTGGAGGVKASWRGVLVEGGVSHFNGCKYFISVLLPTIAGIHVIAFYAEDKHM